MATTDATAAQRHVPVMLEPVLDLLGPVLGDGAVHVDGTLGMGGHAEAVLRRHPGVRLVAIDRDLVAVGATEHHSVLDAAAHHVMADLAGVDMGEVVPAEIGDRQLAEL